MQTIKSIFFKFKTWLVEHYHLMFRSAAENHLRAQQCVHNEDGTYECSVNFASFTELKRYQKKLRRITVSLSTAVAMVIVAVLVAPLIMNPNKSQAAAFQWIQSNWDNTSTGATTKTGWKNYTSKDTNIDVLNSGEDLALHLHEASATGEANATDANHSTFAGNLTAYPNAGVYIDGGNLTLKKVNTAAAVSAGECASGILSDGYCGPCGSGAPITDTRDPSNSTYNIVTVGTQCWLARNLNVGTPLANGNTMPADPFDYNTIEKWCPMPSGTVGTTANNDATAIANCASDGGLYTWAETLGLPLACNTSNTGACSDASIGTNRKGICPTGWHVSSDAEIKTLEMALGMTQAQADATSWRGTDQGTNMKVGGSSGLNMPLAGYRLTNGYFYYRALNGYYWSSTQSDAYLAWSRDLYSGDANVARGGSSKAHGFSVRCLKD